MVLLPTKALSYSTRVCGGPVQSGLKIASANILSLDNILNKLCEACHIKKMSCIPPSAFSAGRIRDTQRDLKVSNPSKGAGSTKYFNTTFMEPSPLKYNSKLMNSIWGLYNRYSPHNVKKVMPTTSPLEQAVNSPNKNEPVITLPSVNRDNVWATINVSQSH